ncbi:MalY/PatB family protein [Williamwhitmania taraxaci]|uniref:cysteine-S-conjugate beta-lyase n=1 Tax=Williamwhitmania taraxaci TaxID=1640674 RepID=A0A1G6H4M8_9BACT|nr:PatB family C-S lyase [Williamwhitmania taraxaci]SDB88386.1 cystathione beta-lyase [Williamwhitmania taraxaci]
MIIDYSFNTKIARENTSCVKYDRRSEVFGSSSVTPLWVADMDFATPAFIREALQQRIDHPILGYTFLPSGAVDAAIGWVYRRHGWKIESNWICLCPGIVPAINFAILANSKVGEKAVIQPPVYTPFFAAIEDHKRVVVENPLLENEGCYTMDLNHLEQQFKEGVKLLILSNPHNPTGRVYTKNELEQVASLASKYNVVIISDEIHCDIVMPHQKHIPIASLSEDAANRTITLIAPSKTFNLAGLATGLAIIPNETLRAKFNSILNSLHLSMGNLFGNIAMQAAYTSGDEWVDGLNAYLYNNFQTINTILKSSNAPFRSQTPEGTYLAWIDFREFNLPQQELNRILIETANVGLSDGTIYGKQGIGFQRLNAACPKSVIENAVARIAESFSKA